MSPSNYHIAPQAPRTGGVKPRSVAERFWARVHKCDGCWNWLGPLRGTGPVRYGVVFLGRSSEGRTLMRGAHQVAWELEHGAVPKGREVCHGCDNPLCVRIDHLFLGSHATNMADARRKGRTPAGERNGQARLTSEAVERLRSRRAAGERIAVLSNDFNISPTQVCRIVAGVNWRASA